MTITSASTNSVPQHYNTSQDYSSLSSNASLESIISTPPTVSPSSLAPKPNNHAVAKAALMGAAIAFAGPLATPILGNMAKTVAGKLLPKAGGVASHVAKPVLGNTAKTVAGKLLPQARNVASYVANLGKVQEGVKKVVGAAVSKVAGGKAGKMAAEMAGKAFKTATSTKSNHKTQQKPEAKKEAKKEAREEAPRNKKPDSQNNSQPPAGGTATPLNGKSGEGFQFKPDQSSNTKFSQHKNNSGEYDFVFSGTQEENKKQYYKLAKELHPDKNPNDSEATKAFQALNKAYNGDE